MKKLTRFTIAFFAAQLLFVGIASAAVRTNISENKSTVNVVLGATDPADDVPYEIF